MTSLDGGAERPRTRGVSSLDDDAERPARDAPAPRADARRARAGAPRPPAGAPRPRSWLEVRWRQLRNPPPPVLRAVLANLLVAAGGGAGLLLYDVTSPSGVPAELVALYVALVIVAGSVLTYLWVELPTGASGVRRRTGWAALLGLFASLPTAYLVLVVVFQLIRPLLG